MIVAVDDDGCFIDRISDFKGRYVKGADKDIITAGKARIYDRFHIITVHSVECCKSLVQKLFAFKVVFKEDFLSMSSRCAFG